MFKEEVSTVELGDDEMIEVEEPLTTAARPEGPPTTRGPAPIAANDPTVCSGAPPPITPFG